MRTVALDIECRKIRAPKGWIHPYRFETFMVGLAYRNEEGVLIVQLLENETESALMDQLAERLKDFDRVIYLATRNFDEMVLAGRWTSARRAHAPEGGPWPTLKTDWSKWLNVRKLLKDPVERNYDDDCLSKDVPKIWDKGGATGKAIVRTHCRIDVKTLFLNWERQENPTADEVEINWGLWISRDKNVVQCDGCGGDIEESAPHVRGIEGCCGGMDDVKSDGEECASCHGLGRRLCFECVEKIYVSMKLYEGK